MRFTSNVGEITLATIQQVEEAGKQATAIVQQMVLDAELSVDVNQKRMMEKIVRRQLLQVWTK